MLHLWIFDRPHYFPCLCQLWWRSAFVPIYWQLILHYSDVTARGTWILNQLSGTKTYWGKLVDDNWLKNQRHLPSFSVNLTSQLVRIIWLGNEFFGWPLLSFVRVHFVRAVWSNISDAHQCFWEKNMETDLLEEKTSKKCKMSSPTYVKC